MILTALKNCYDRLADAPLSGISPYGYSDQPISFVLVLSAGGRILDLVDFRDSSGRKPQPRSLSVPQPVKRTSAVVPNFLWDKTAYVFGVKRDPATKEPVPAEREHAAFQALHEELLAETGDEGLQALLAFLSRWNPADFASLPNHEDALDTNIVFRFADEHRFQHDRPAARDIWARRLVAQGGAEGFCLVTGMRAPIARLHPRINGISVDGQKADSIVSFNWPAFTSYGKAQGENAPVSEQAAFAYTTALNELLRRDSRNRVQIADATTVFWAEAPPAEAEAAELVIGAALYPPTTDDEEAAKLRDALHKIAQGRPLAEIDPELHEETRFHLLGLAPNAARLSVRFWHVDTLGAFKARLHRHWSDLSIEPRPWQTPPAVRRLLYEIAVQGRAENIPPNLAGEVMRAILTGGRYPRSLLTATIMRMRAEQSVTGLRAAIVKACLVREQEEVPMALDRSESNPGYRLGRLFAVLESVQRAALGRGVSATIRDRYYGAASATPASVFPMILRTAGHHLSNLRKGDKGGLAHWFEQEIGDIMDGLGSAFPRNLRLEDQGRFAIGYYHEREALVRRRGDTPPDLADTLTEGETAEGEEQ